MVKVFQKIAAYDDWLPEFRLTRPEEMHANPNHKRPDPASIVVPLLDRLPMQPPMPAYNPRIAKNRLWEKPAKPLGDMLHTERLFHLLNRERAVVRDTAERIERRREEIDTQFFLFEKQWVDAELVRRAAFYRKVADIIVSRKTRHEKARAFQLAAWEFLRERSGKRAAKEHDGVAFLIQRAAERAREWLNFRTEDLYVKTGDHTYRRLKVHGQPRENVMGDLHWELAQLMTEMNQKWRLSDLRVTTPNGSIQHVKHGGGKHVETLTAELHEPLLRERTRQHEFWHDTNFQIQTPNNSLMHAKQQGGKPEAATARIAQPLKDRRTAAFDYWHDRNFLIETPNHSLQPATRQGGKPEKATADLQVPLRERKTAQFDHWHDTNFRVSTPNHSLQPANHQGATPEAATAELQVPVRDEKTARFALWHASHEFKHTPNGGYAPLLNSGVSIEQVTGEYTAGLKAKVSENHLADRLANLYVPTENGTWRRLARSGKSVEHVTADVKEHHDQADLEAQDRSNAKRILKARQSLKEIHKNLAAHEIQKSLFQDHALKRPEPLVEKPLQGSAPEPVPDLPKLKKAG